MEISKQIEEEKQKILNNFLNNAPFDGWNLKNLKKSCSQIGRDETYALLLFPEALEEFNWYFHNFLNNRMEELSSQSLPSKTNEKVIYLLEKKFETYNQYKEAIRNYAKFNLSPANILTAKSMLWDSCDRIWRLAGDESIDFNYYTKRAILAAVYSSSFIYFLNDDSENFLKTRYFIQARIQNALSIGKFKQKIKKLFKF